MSFDYRRTLWEALTEMAASRPDHPAIAFGGERITFGELVLAARRLAAGLRHHGVGRGDRVALLAPNMPEHVLLILAAAQLGAIHVPIHPQWTFQETMPLLASSEPRLLIVSADKTPIAEAVVRQGTVAKAFVIGRTLERPATHRVEDVGILQPFEELLAHGAVEEDEAVSTDVLALWFSSGTTGKPKAAMWSHETVLFNSLAWMHRLGLGGDDITLKVVPLAHNGLTSGVIGPLLVGSTVHIGRKVDPSEMLRTLRDEGITYFEAVPSVLALLADRAAAAGITSLPSVRVVVFGAAKTTLDVIERSSALMPNATLFYVYGGSEGQAVCAGVQDLKDPSGLGSVGYPNDGMQIRVLDERGDPVPANVPGIISIKGPATMLGYWRDERLTATVMDSDGWVTVGDYGRFDEAGRLWIVGRDKDVLNVGGYKVYSLEVENALTDLPQVRAAAVVGVPDDVLGEKPVAYVVVESAAGWDADAAKRSLAERLAKYKLPAEIHVVDALPTNALGKVQKHLLAGATDRQSEPPRP